MIQRRFDRDQTVVCLQRDSRHELVIYRSHRLPGSAQRSRELFNDNHIGSSFVCFAEQRPFYPLRIVGSRLPGVFSASCPAAG
jgi:hypothetical protein